MRKTIILLFPIIFILSGCSNIDKYIEKDYENTKNIAMENIKYHLDYLDKFLIENIQSYSIINLSSDDINLGLDFYLYNSGLIVDKKNEKFEDNLNLHYLDKKENKELFLSGYIDFLEVSGDNFIKISDLILDIGTGNYKGNLFNLISSNLDSKWIYYKSKMLDNFNEILQNIEEFGNIISNPDNFEYIDQVNYDGYFAYKVGINQNLLDDYNEKSLIKIDNIDILFIVKSNEDVDIRIINLSTSGQYNLNIIGNIGKNEGYFDIKNGINISNITYSSYKKYTDFIIKKSSNFIENRNINLKHYFGEIGENQSKIYGKIYISPLIIYGTDIENGVEIYINYLREIQTGNILDLAKPDRFILLDQILGDEYSLLSLIGDNVK